MLTIQETLSTMFQFIFELTVLPQVHMVDTFVDCWDIDPVRVVVDIVLQYEVHMLVVLELQTVEYLDTGLDKDLK